MKFNAVLSLLDWCQMSIFGYAVAFLCVSNLTRGVHPPPYVSEFHSSAVNLGAIQQWCMVFRAGIAQGLPVQNTGAPSYERHLSNWSDGSPKTGNRRPPVNPHLSSFSFLSLYLYFFPWLFLFLHRLLCAPCRVTVAFTKPVLRPLAASSHSMPFFNHGSSSPAQNNATHNLNTLSDEPKETTRSPPSKLLCLLIMENFVAPSTIIANFNHGESNVGCSHNFDSSMNEFSVNESLSYPSTASISITSQLDSPEQYRHKHESLQFPGVLPSGHDPSYPFCSSSHGLESWVNLIPMGFQSGVHTDGHAAMGLSELQEQKIWDLYMSKAARSNRKLVRETEYSLRRNPSGAAASGSSTRRLTMYGADTAGQNSKENVQKDAYTFCSPDNKKLRVLLKQLKNSDVGNLGRIVLPKREAEANLPSLSNKEGIPIVIIDVYSNQEWGMRFRYWSNNKSRMYVLENTGDFVKQNALENGDCITLYEDESKDLYFSIKKVKRPACEPTNKHCVANYNYLYVPNLIEELRHKEQLEANSLVMLPTDDSFSSYGTCEEAENCSSNNVTYEANSAQPTLEMIQARMAAIQPSSSSEADMMGSDGHQNDFNDCFSGLGTLPAVSRRYSYSLIDQLMNELPDMEEDDMMIGKPSNLCLL